MKTILIISILSICFSLFSREIPDTLWTHMYGSSGTEELFDMKETSDNGFILAGYTDFWGSGSDDMYLIKCDYQGVTEWTGYYGSEGIDTAYSVIETVDGGFLVLGRTDNGGTSFFDLCLVKINSNGVEQWSQTYGGAEPEIGYSIVNDVNGGYVITGVTNSFGEGNGDVWLLKVDEAGNVVWSNTFGGSNLDIGFEVKQVSDNGFVITGITSSTAGYSENLYLVKTDENGDLEWEKDLGGYYFDDGQDVIEGSDGGYLVAGSYKNSLTEPADVWLIKVDETGEVEWDNTYGGLYRDVAYSVIENSENDYLISGGTFVEQGQLNSEIFLLKTTSQGEEIWLETYGTPENEFSRVLDKTEAGNIIIGATHSSLDYSDSDIWLLFLTNDVTFVNETTETKETFLTSYPNPFNPLMTKTTRLKISYELPRRIQAGKLQIFDIRGKLVREISLKKKEGLIEWNGKNNEGKWLSTGLYFYRIRHGSFISETEKLLLLK